MNLHSDVVHGKLKYDVQKVRGLVTIGLFFRFVVQKVNIVL